MLAKFHHSDTLAAVLRRTHAQFPDQTAIYLLGSRQTEQAITYRELFRGAASYAQELMISGIRPGDVCIVILNHSAELIYAFFGAILAGAVPAIMPFLTEKLSPIQYRASLIALIEITRPSAVISNADFASEIRTARGVGSSPNHILISEDISTTIDPNNLPEANPKKEDIVLLQHSSGTTGLQKGVALSHQAIFNQLNSYSRAIQLTAQDVVVSWLPLYHDMGLIAGFLMPILCRVPLVLMSPFDWVRAPHKLLQAVTRFRGTLSWLPNFAYNFCAQKISDRHLVDVELSSWRAVINCSEPMHWNSHQMFLERFIPYGLRPEALATSYAMAENVFAVTQGGIGSPLVIDFVNKHTLLNHHIAEPCDDPAKTVNIVSAGQAIENTCIRVIDSHGVDLPERKVGEIAIQSNCMLSEYFHRPDLTQEAFLDRWYLTGDMGYLVGGELYITGRKKDLIIIGGKNLYPQDLERLASEVPGVHPGRVVAFGVNNELAGTEDVVIIAEADQTDPAQLIKLGDEIRSKVTSSSDIALRYVHIVHRGWLLKTSSGKIARSANREKYLAEVR